MSHIDYIKTDHTLILNKRRTFILMILYLMIERTDFTMFLINKIM